MLASVKYTKKGNKMDTSELRAALAAILKKLDDSKFRSESGTVVTVENPDGTSRDVDLWALASGTLVKVCGSEYMNIVGGNWVKYTGEIVSPEELADKIRTTSRSDGLPRLVHIG